MADVRCLLIVSHVVHYQHQGRLYAYGPYAREIDVWADLFESVRIASPCRDAPPPKDAAAFTRPNITITPQRETGGATLGAKLRQILLLPRLAWDLGRAMGRADAVHVRCPGNLGLLGTALAPLFTRHRIAKYAGQWSGYPGEALSVRLQRVLLRSRWWNAPVTVYGEWPNQPAHVVPFFTSVMDDEQVAQAEQIAAARAAPYIPRVLYVGRLSRAKNVHVLIKALAALRPKGVRMPCDIVGDGPERDALLRQITESGLEEQVTLVGAVPFEQVAGFYARADVLVLASETEGWPKAIAEAMAFGLVVIGSERGLIPWMLSDGRGLTVPPGDTRALVEVLKSIAEAPGNYEVMQQRAAAWAQQHSLSGLREAIHTLLNERWGITLGTPSEAVYA